jgi:hypothetical protein
MKVLSGLIMPDRSWKGPYVPVKVCKTYLILNFHVPLKLGGGAQRRKYWVYLQKMLIKIIGMNVWIKLWNRNNRT